jgi:ketosteroid isomerase-like protein
MMRRTTAVLSACAVFTSAVLFLLVAQGQQQEGGAKVVSTAKEGARPDEPPADEKETHDALIALRDRILAKHDAKDIDGVLAELDESAVVTMQDGTVCRGPQAVKDYYEEKVGSDDSVVKELKTVCVIDRWSRLYNDQSTAVVDGRLEQDYFLRDGKQFHLVSPWTATLIKQGDDWKISAFHVSANMFDNGVLDLFVQQNRLWTGIFAGVAGLVVGLAVGALLFGRGRGTSRRPTTSE